MKTKITKIQTQIHLNYFIKKIKNNNNSHLINKLQTNKKNYIIKIKQFNQKKTL